MTRFWNNIDQVCTDQAINNPNKVKITGRKKTKWRKHYSLKSFMSAWEVPYGGIILSFSYCCIDKKSLKIPKG